MLCNFFDDESHSDVVRNVYHFHMSEGVRYVCC